MPRLRDSERHRWQRERKKARRKERERERERVGSPRSGRATRGRGSESGKRYRRRDAIRSIQATGRLGSKPGHQPLSACHPSPFSATSRAGRTPGGTPLDLSNSLSRRQGWDQVQYVLLRIRVKFDIKLSFPRCSFTRLLYTYALESKDEKSFDECRVMCVQFFVQVQCRFRYIYIFFMEGDIIKFENVIRKKKCFTFD